MSTTTPPARSPLLHRSLIATMLRLDRSRISFPMALRNTLGFALPLILLTALGQPALGVIMGMGTLNVAFADQAGTDYTKAARMLATAAGAAVAVFAGAALGAHGWVVLPVLALLGFWGGLLAAFGAGTMQVGTAAIISYLVMTGNPQPPLAALGLAALVLGGGLFQTLLSMIDWPVRGVSPVRLALAASLRALASYARAPSTPIAGDPPGSATLLDAGRLLALRGDRADAGSAPDIDQAIFASTQRLQTDLLALGRMVIPASGSRRAPDSTKVGRAIARVLANLASHLATGQPSPALTRSRIQLDHASTSFLALAGLPGATSGRQQRYKLGLLAGQIRVIQDELDRLAELVAAERHGRTPTTWSLMLRGWTIRFDEGVATIRANLTLKSAIFRHACRLAACLALADALVRILGIPHGYWAPMTVAVILRPDFGNTMTRGVARLIGTAIGLELATLILHVVAPGLWSHVVLVVALTFAIRVLAPVNAILAAITISAYLVALLSMLGAAPATTVADRSLNTAIGGALALASFIVWPTWEIHLIPDALGSMIAALRAASGTVLSTWLGVTAAPGTIDRLRMESRLARSNATASVNRLRNDPGVDDRRKQQAQHLVTQASELAIAMLTLESYLHQVEGRRIRSGMRAFTQALDEALAWVEAAVQDREPTGEPPTALYAAARALRPGDDQDEDDGSAIRRVIAAEAADIADIVSAMISVARIDTGNDAPGDVAGARPAPAAPASA